MFTSLYSATVRSMILNCTEPYTCTLLRFGSRTRTKTIAEKVCHTGLIRSLLYHSFLWQCVLLLAEPYSCMLNSAALRLNSNCSHHQSRTDVRPSWDECFSMLDSASLTRSSLVITRQNHSRPLCSILHFILFLGAARRIELRREPLRLGGLNFAFP